MTPRSAGRAVVATLVAAAQLVACSTVETVERDDSSAVTEAVAGFVPRSPNWSDCATPATTGDVECATVEVPLDWDAPQGELIELAVARRLATGRRIGALFTNPGGPGGSGLQYLFGGPFGAPLTEHFDIVSWDPRGVGQSTALDCDSNVERFLANDPSPDDDTEQQAIDTDAEAVAAECGVNHPELVANMGTDSVARDLEVLRVALREESLNYIGFSYGTLVGLRYLDLFASSARSIVLDGVVDPTEGFATWLENQTVALDRSVAEALDDCEATAGCPLDAPAETFDRLAAQIETAPIGPVGPAEFATAAIYASYDGSLRQPWFEAIAAAVNGDGQPIADLAAAYYDFGGFTAYAAVECLDSPHPEGSAQYREFADRLASLSPRIGAAVANELLPCAYWPAPPDPIVGEVIAADSPPVLVLGNTGDAATPYENSVKIADMLANGHLVTHRGQGHTSYGRSECVDDAVEDYLIELTVPEVDPEC